MNAFEKGLLFPSSTIDQSWFQIFYYVVAFNTIIYLGLTISKLIPWPEQIHASRVRGYLPKRMQGGETKMHIDQQNFTEPENSFDYLMRRAIINTIPRSLWLMGAIVISISVINAVVLPNNKVEAQVTAILVGILFLILSQLFYKKVINTKIMSWTCVAASTLLVGNFGWQSVIQHKPVSLTYCIITLVVMPAIIMDWKAATVGGIIQWIIVSICGAQVKSIFTLDYAIPALAALLAGIVLLQIRIKSVDALSLERMNFQRMASTDLLTGLLNRNGLITLANNLFGSLDDQNIVVYLAICDISEMGVMNDLYGIPYGDSLIGAVGRAVKSVIPSHNLIARWDGDTFLSIGTVQFSDSAKLKADIEAALITGGTTLGKRPVKVSVGTASGKPGEITLEQLVDNAVRRGQT